MKKQKKQKCLLKSASRFWPTRRLNFHLIRTYFTFKKAEKAEKAGKAGKAAQAMH